MPIRSDRGRNATLRALATWPLHSPRRLVSTIAVLVVLSAAATITASTTTANRSSTPAASNSTPAWTLPQITVTSRPTNPQLSAAVVAGDPAAAALRFAEAWVRDLDASTWRDAVAPLCTDEFRAVVLPALTPDHASTVTGAPVVTRAVTGVAEVTVPLDAMVLAVTLQDTTGRGDWRVSDVQPKGR